MTAFFPLQVVFSSLLSAVFLKRRPTPSEYVAAAMVIGGLVAMLCAKRLQAVRSRDSLVGLRVALSAETETDDGRGH